MVCLLRNSSFKLLGILEFLVEFNVGILDCGNSRIPRFIIQLFLSPGLAQQQLADQ